MLTVRARQRRSDHHRARPARRGSKKRSSGL